MKLPSEFNSKMMRRSHAREQPAAAVALVVMAFPALMGFMAFGFTPLALANPTNFTNSTHSANLNQLATTQKQLAEQNAQKSRAQDYVWNKAQRWLDVAQDEYRNNNRGGTPAQALAQAQRLTTLVDDASAGLSNPSVSETPLLQNAPRIRSDLWQGVADWKAQAQHSDSSKAALAQCAAGTVAQLEVQLAWAAWVQAHYGWRSARPYVAHAEQLHLNSLQQQRTCEAQPKALMQSVPPVVQAVASASIPVAAPAPVVLTAPAAVQPTPSAVVALGSLVYFERNRSRLSLDAQANLQRIAQVLKAHPDVQMAVEGYADDTGSTARNQRLSQQRAQRVAEALEAAGVAPQRMLAQGLGTIVPSALVQNQKIAAGASEPRNRRVQLRLNVSTEHPVLQWLDTHATVPKTQRR